MLWLFFHMTSPIDPHVSSWKCTPFSCQWENMNISSPFLSLTRGEISQSGPCDWIDADMFAPQCQDERHTKQQSSSTDTQLPSPTPHLKQKARKHSDSTAGLLAATLLTPQPDSITDRKWQESFQLGFKILHYESLALHLPASWIYKMKLDWRRCCFRQPPKVHSSVFIRRCRCISPAYQRRRCRTSTAPGRSTGSDSSSTSCHRRTTR